MVKGQPLKMCLTRLSNLIVFISVFLKILSPNSFWAQIPNSLSVMPTAPPPPTRQLARSGDPQMSEWWVQPLLSQMSSCHLEWSESKEYLLALPQRGRSLTFSEDTFIVPAPKKSWIRAVPPTPNATLDPSHHHWWWPNCKNPGAGKDKKVSRSSLGDLLAIDLITEAVPWP